MNEDDPTKDLPKEEEPIGILPPAPHTEPMLDRILKEVISTREMLLSRLGGIEQQLEQVNNKLDVLGRHALSTEAEVVALGKRLEKLEGERA